MKTTRLIYMLLCALLLCGCASKAEEHTSTLLAMDTVMELTAYGENGQAAVEETSALIEELDSLLSVTDESSEIYALDHGKTVELSPHVSALLSEALTLCADTSGALDITIYPVVRAWGFTTGQYQIPDQETLSALLERVDHTQVQVHDGSLTLPECVELDLGAVAKGYAGDRVMDIFRSHGVTSAKIALGGNVQVLGGKPDGSSWRIAVQAPDEDNYAGVIEVKDRAVVTSGGYERYFEADGVRYWHILDPATGCPARSGLSSVTIVSPSGTLADSLSTALFVMGKDSAVDFWRGRDDFEFILIGEDGGVTISEGLSGSFTLSADWAGHGLEVVRR